MFFFVCAVVIDFRLQFSVLVRLWVRRFLTTALSHWNDKNDLAIFYDLTIFSHCWSKVGKT